MMSAWMWLAVPFTALISTVWVRAGIAYAHRRGLLDVPGQRRSHRIATPRGGGAGMILAFVLCIGLPWLILTDSPRIPVGLLTGLLLVALIGWIDDHRPLAARIRLIVHLLASAALASALLWPVLPATGWLPAGLVLALIVVSSAWSINLHNFMDGINGLLACQAVFVFCVFAGLGWSSNDPWFPWICVGAAAATAGFLPWNFPRAQMFMGDVGSGALGFLIAAMAWLGILQGVIGMAEVLIACSAFVTDATCTLLSRMLRGRRWYSAHREHLYQWLARSHASHTRVVVGYGVWNLLIVIPLMLLSRIFAPADLQWTAVLVCYALAVCAWWAGKRHCLRHASRKGLHASH